MRLIDKGRTAEPPVEVEKLPYYIWIIIAVVVVLFIAVIVGGIFYYRNKRKKAVKKNQAMLDGSAYQRM